MRAALRGIAALVLVVAACARTERADAPAADSTSAALDTGPAIAIPVIAEAEPIDGALEIAEVRIIRDSLLAIVMRRDSSALLAMVAENVKNGFGGDDGKEEFRKMWFGPDAGEPGIWWELEDILRHGGEAYDGGFTAPYWFTLTLPDDADVFSALVVIDSVAVVRDRPDSNAHELARIGYVVVSGSDVPDLPDPWRAIDAGNGRIGYLAASAVRSPVGYRLALVKENGRWLIAYLVAGD